MVKNSVIGGLLCLYFASLASCSDLLGVLQLDTLSFNKTVRKFPYSFIKFDTGYPTGEKHKSFAELGLELAKVNG